MLHYKIASKAIILRLEKVLCDLISDEQFAYVTGRNIFDAVRSIGDIMDYTKLYNLPFFQSEGDLDREIPCRPIYLFYLWKPSLPLSNRIKI